MVTERHEIIEFAPQIPVKFFMHQLGIVGRHWHNSPELLLVLDGEVRLTADEDSFLLKSEDLFLINSNSIHEIHSQSAVLIAIQFKPEMFSRMEMNLEELVFDCNSTADRDPQDFKGLRYGIAKMLRENTHRSSGTDARNISLSYFLLAELLSNFCVPETNAVKVHKKYMHRLTRIIDYIDEHYRENFTLNDLAESQQLSVPYLSGFFNKHMGITFSQYYSNVKLEHAVADLINTDHSIETVAMDHGFTESHSFVRAFKKKYQMLPSAYRKEYGKEKSRAVVQDNLNYIHLEPSNYLNLLTKYLPANDTYGSDSPSIKSEVLEIPPVSALRVSRRLRHTFKKFITVGRARDLLNHHIQEMLRDIQKNIGYEYIKFHGIFSDDMMVCSRHNEELQFRFTLVDMALDFLLSIGLKPMIQLSFMPAALASDSKKLVFQCPFNTSPPADMEEWNLLVRRFTEHLFQRFGRGEVLSWPFCVWNEPETSRKMFGFENDPLFFEFYRNTYRTVKEVCPNIQFGSPSLLYLENHGDAWLRSYFSYAKSHECMPDFINLHYYADIIPTDCANGYTVHTEPHSMLPRREDDFSLFIGSIRKIFRSCGAGSLPIYLTEWNLTFSHRNLINDTCFKSCYILKNLLKNYDRLDSFGYWSLTDLLEENALPQELFHGGLGIYTMNGLRKNTFYSFYFANQLGNELLDSGDGYFITRKENSYQILTYNYIHYGDLFAAGEMFDITQTSRYSPFNMSRRLSVSITLTDLPNGRYQVKEYFVNRKHGSAFDLWVGFGGIPLGPEDTRLLKGLCVPGFQSAYRLVEEHTLSWQAHLEPLEIRLTQLELL